MGIDLINFDLPIEYIDGSPARYLGRDANYGHHAVTPRGRPRNETGNFYDEYGQHIYGERMRIRNVAPPPPPHRRPWKCATITQCSVWFKRHQRTKHHKRTTTTRHNPYAL